MEDSLLTKYLNSRCFYNKGLQFQNTIKKNIKNNIKHNDKIYGGNSTIIPKYQLVKIIEEYHDECCSELTNEIYDYLNDRFNNQCGYNMNPMEINIDEIKKMILDITKKYLKLDDDNKKTDYNLIHLDKQNDELYNDVSLDLLEDNENAKIDNDINNETYNYDDIKINTMTIEEVYDQYIVYGSPGYESYKEYLVKLMNKLEDDIDDVLMDKLRDRFK